TGFCCYQLGHSEMWRPAGSQDLPILKNKVDPVQKHYGMTTNKTTDSRLQHSGRTPWGPIYFYFPYTAGRTLRAATRDWP
ncbi:MAG: hypothetical protein Q4P84_06570, partial [Elusimicrobiales bacterium]|nr:hypothetical protein [Elusimicrobiales bacterium]